METYAKGRVIKHIPLNELQHLIRKESNKHIYQRLLFIYQLYLNKSIERACKTMCLSTQTGYNWLKQWNEKGYKGLIPDFGGGRHSKLTTEQKEQLKKKLKSQGNWLTSQIRALIKHDFGITYSIRHVARILREFGMHYAKPYSRDYRQPENAKELLAENIEEASKSIMEKSIIGFLDQAAPQTTDNKQRFWSFEKPRIYRNTTRYRANTFGFYPINGKEVVEFMERSTSPYVCEFLRMIRMKNPKKHILLFLDNARSHIAKMTRKCAGALNITLIFLPPYSPELNPIELIWKGIRRRVSQIFVKSEWSLKETIRTIFHRLAKKPSFMKGWLNIFMPKISKLL